MRCVIIQIGLRQSDCKSSNPLPCEALHSGCFSHFGDIMKPWAKAFYNSRRWQACRTSYIGKRMSIDGGRCERCVEKFNNGEITEGEIQQGFILHHKIPLTEQTIRNPYITLNEDNLQYVCKDCHDEFEGHGLNQGNRTNHETKIKLKCKFDEDGLPLLRETR